MLCLYVIQVLTNCGFWFIDPFQVRCLIDKSAVGFPLNWRDIVEFERMQKIALGSMFTIIANSDVVGAYHRLLVFVFGVRDEDIVGHWWFAYSSEFD